MIVALIEQEISRVIGFLFYLYDRLFTFDREPSIMSTMPSSAIRDSLRAKIFGIKRGSKIIVIGEEDGVKFEVEVRQPLAGDMLDQVDSGSARERMARMMVQTVFVPGTDEKVFQPEDADAIMDMPVGGIYQSIIDAITSFVSASNQVTSAKNSSEVTLS